MRLQLCQQKGINGRLHPISGAHFRRRYSMERLISPVLTGGLKRLGQEQRVSEDTAKRKARAARNNEESFFTIFSLLSTYSPSRMARQQA